MENFNYSIPTKVYFGKGQIKNLAAIIKEYGNKILIAYGGGSIKKIGLYDEMIKILNDNSISYVELSGIEPNPRIETVRKGIKICKENNVEVVLAVGGGSTIDCAKVIAAGVKYEVDPWDLVTSPQKINEVLPIVTILTLSATGSEMDPHAVISDMTTNQKLGTGHENMKPKASILDPEYTYSVPKNQTAAGTADIMSHIFETYFNHTKGVDIQDSTAEGLLRACIKYGKIAIENPKDYDARANLMWASSWAINGLISYGTNSPWVVHPMEHELSAFYDITHGVGLAILTPHWMKYSLDDTTVFKFAQYGINVWGIDKNLDKFEIANKAIEKTSEFFKELGIPSTLREVGIKEDKLELMAKKAMNPYFKYAFKPLDENDILKIFKAAL
ncbi:iron-containing alcohol dehydrogenase [Clostridium beijerinckii]|jgi:alcohol dehydrogenase YqhD (iron-dependent ADH family)|uniref:Iron-containing alcohol dehydrogenase n=2 Tax=Clostridium beijerinckii TaxID=1520 RepID=A0AAW3WER6_CLOBE|nr:iron-containing alcohol dehydrogenase [Clostridium beijerinckii]MBC2459824.1 iron-containing alcohol dehydrogenase [Clostridium beijerinckii]MBC2477327.1 iron-containing alcohol dehydrogenase [Clostridium beijerinckii]MCI1579183.1 iron-containing alcohol dehydrogenase [Clostridium beijerinckii]MCI1585783.1 iron-containing alcohol dehydrogenase [Clostridium beijerinckii]MCI1623154.1 iron-containing alcohol dehydrogenase [Clostridium beijerinckii]